MSASWTHQLSSICDYHTAKASIARWTSRGNQDDQYDLITTSDLSVLILIILSLSYQDLDGMGISQRYLSEALSSRSYTLHVATSINTGDSVSRDR